MDLLDQASLELWTASQAHKTSSAMMKMNPVIMMMITTSLALMTVMMIEQKLKIDMFKTFFQFFDIFLFSFENQIAWYFQPSLR